MNDISGKGKSNRSKTKVVVFGGGPVLQYGIKRFLQLLEEHTEIELLAVICESQGRSWAAVWLDIWRRRKLLVLPVFLMKLGGDISRFLCHPAEQRRLQRCIRRLAGRISFVPDIHSERVLSHVKTLKPDLGLIYGSPVLKPELFEIPALGTLGIHHGKVPHYRGKKTTFWAIYNREQTAGVTIQKVDQGLDTGKIVQTGEVPIGKRSLRSVWLDVERLGLELYIKAILEVRTGVAVFQPQTGPVGKLYRDPKPRDIVRFWLRRLTRLLAIKRSWYPTLFIS